MHSKEMRSNRLIGVIRIVCFRFRVSRDWNLSSNSHFAAHKQLPYFVFESWISLRCFGSLCLFSKLSSLLKRLPVTQFIAKHKWKLNFAFILARAVEALSASFVESKFRSFSHWVNVNENSIMKFALTIVLVALAVSSSSGDWIFLRCGSTDELTISDIQLNGLECESVIPWARVRREKSLNVRTRITFLPHLQFPK